jgi:fructose-1,6-bisphosphatase I
MEKRINLFENRDFHVLVESIKDACTQIEHLIRRSSLNPHHKGVLEQMNFSGDEQKPLDIKANEIMIEHLTKTKLCSYLLSEENEDAIELNHGPYMVTFDPVDGSSNIDCNVCVGTIFSIYKPFVSPKKEDHLLREGDEIEIAGYALYGPSTELVIAINKTKVLHYALDPDTKTFTYLNDISLENKNKKYYSINEGNSEQWFDDMREYINLYKHSGYSQRYIGSMVADVHRTLMYGGMFSYPQDKQNFFGKLRLVYECFPMSFITEAAGGESVEKDKRLLAKTPKSIHQRSSLLLGTKKEIQKYKDIFSTLNKD